MSDTSKQPPAAGHLPGTGTPRAATLRTACFEAVRQAGVRGLIGSAG